MRRLVAFGTVALTILVAACSGNESTGPSTQNDPVVAPKGVIPPSFAFAEHPSGMWIHTDKNDYSPGDRVVFTGGGWQPGDTLDVHLVNDSTQAEQPWTIAIDSEGAFADSTYLVSEVDLNLSFTLTATSRANPEQTLTVNFTDGALSLTAPTAPAGTPSFPYASGNVTFTARNATTGSPSGTHTNVRVTIRTAGNMSPTPPALHQTLTVTASLTENTTASVVWNGTNSSGNPLAEGLYGIRVLSNQSGEPNNSPLEIVMDRTAPNISTSSAPAVSPNQSTSGPPGVPVTFTATASDPVVSGVNANNYRVVSAEYRIGSGSWLAMTAADGNFNNATETLTATIPAATVALLSTGQHLVCVRTTDRANNRSADALAGNANCATLTINAAAVATTTTVTSSQNPSSLGDPVTFTATVTSGSSPVLPVGSGQVSFKTGGSSCSNATEVQTAQTVDGNGQVTYTPSPNLTLGSHVIRACYLGATGFLASEGSVTQVVENTATEIALTSSVNPSKTGQSVTFKAKVTNNSSPVTAGTVTFKRGGTSCSVGSSEVQGAQAPNGSGEVTYATSFNASESPITIHACYSGSTTPKFGASEASLVQDVDPAATTTTVESSANPSVFSQPVTFTVTVAVVAPGAGTPGGTVKLVNGACIGGDELGSASLSGGQATFNNITELPVGSHTVRGCYQGNADFVASSGPVTQIVNRASTTTTISSDANPSVFSQPVTFTVTVAAASPATATPTGSVTIEQGGTACGNGTTVLSTQSLSSGQATFSTSALDAGLYTIRGCYAETTNFKASAGEVEHTVQKASTTTALSSSVNPSILAQPVTFTVTVSSVSPATATPVGNVTLTAGTCAAGTTIGGGAAALSGGQATFTVSSLSVGIHTVSACYAGTSNFEPSDNSVSQQVKYNFEGLFAPVDRPTTMNVSKAGQAVPLKWRLTNYLGVPVLDFSPAALGVAVSGLQCTVSTALDQIEEYAGNSGLQNLGDGYYQFNWKTPPSYLNSCKAIGLNLGEGTARGPLAYFNFKK
ncbi:MAG TPA: Ig-like domain repeat protein [Gemmatimonadales bacterium]|nr:Ig-like domain repeat protein [Gemmatimonadales bacterium]